MNTKNSPTTLKKTGKSRGRNLGFSIIIPVYNHENKIAEVVKKALAHGFPVIVVDDGSTDSSYERIKGIEGICLIRHEKNRGKGAALITGFLEASRYSDWAITIDGDGQHDPSEIPRLMEKIPEKGKVIIVGCREGMTGDDVPWTSSFGRKFSNFWVRVSGSPAIRDSQSGMRIYPLPEALKLGTRARRFQFEVEILVRAGWNGMEVVDAPVSVDYQQGERVSHFRPFLDFLRNSATFTRLILQRIFVPGFMRRKLK